MATAVATQIADAEVQKRRNELYGSHKRDALKKMKGALTEDHIHMLLEEGQRTGNLPTWNSTTKSTFMVRTKGQQYHNIFCAAKKTKNNNNMNALSEMLNKNELFHKFIMKLFLNQY